MIDKSCIIIDDDPQDEVVENLKNDATHYGIRLHCLQLNPQNDSYNKNVGDDNQPDYVIDLDKVISALRSPEYRRLKVDVIACDYNLQDDEVNGYELIRRLRFPRIYKKDVIIYSGNLDTVIWKILQEGSLKEKIHKIRNLTKADIRAFDDKNDYRRSIIEALREDTFSLEAELDSLLDKYGEWTFRSVFPEFKNKKISEILDEIGLESTNSKAFRRAFLENAIAHMIDLNRELNE